MKKPKITRQVLPPDECCYACWVDDTFFNGKRKDKIVVEALHGLRRRIRNTCHNRLNINKVVFLIRAGGYPLSGFIHMTNAEINGLYSSHFKIRYRMRLATD